MDIHGITHMLELIQDKQKVRTVKLIKCKLTDTLMDQFWRYFNQISTLNVAQNHLSEKSIESLISNKAKMPNLRSVVLSQNLIKERTIKNRLE
jgi:hypothetical protein